MQNPSNVGKLGPRVVLAVFALFLSLGVGVLSPTPAGAEPDLRQELQGLKVQLERDRTQMEQDRQRIEQLERQVGSVEAKSEQKSKELEEKIAKQTLEQPSFGQYLDRFAGEHRLSIVGYGFGTFDWQERANTNTFSAGFEPIFLYRLSDRLLFEGDLELKLEDTETSVDLEYAQVDYLVNDYLTVVAGKFLLPFGEFIERQHQVWINKLVSRPLPFREGDEGGLLPFSELGVQARGAVPLGYGEGTRAEYSLYVTNGPRFESDDRGAFVETNNTDQNRAKGYGARLGVDLLPYDAGLGRFRLGASTFDGQWSEHSKRWFTAWGLDAVYQNGPLALRGEYLQTRRAMPTSIPDDKGEGWYIQAAYLLSALPVPYLDHTEFIVRYSGQNQNALTADALAEGFLRNPRLVALGVDYWIAPSVVWKLEYDRDMPAKVPDSNALLTQFAVGF
jgi:phosphate-selective porin O/P